VYGCTGSVSGAAAFQLQFVTGGDPGTFAACCTTEVSSIMFSGAAETVF